MPQDVDSVQTENVSNETDSKVQEPEKADKAAVEKQEPVKPQPSDDDIISKKVQEAVALAMEQGKRELQSTKDKARSEIEKAQREANLHREAFSSFKGSLGELDPEVAKNLELAELRAKDRARQTSEQEQSYAQQQNSLLESFNSGLTEFIKESGIEPTDKRIDWGEDSKSLLEKQQRILKSVNKIHKANQKDAEENQKKTFKEMEAKLRKDLGLDSVDTSNPAGSTSEQTWLEKWGDGDIEATPQNLKKATALQKKFYGG